MSCCKVVSVIGFVVAVTSVCGLPPALLAQDCNSNGIPDECDIDCGDPGGPCDVPGCGQSDDCNGNGIPDECEIYGAYSAVSAPMSPIGDGYPQTFTLIAPPVATSAVTLEFEVVGDFGDSEERINVLINWEWVTGILGGAAAHDCPEMPDTPTRTISAETFNQIVDGGDAEIRLSPTMWVDAFECDPLSYVVVAVSYESHPGDCNTNGIPDECDIAEGTSEDCNDNGTPDECELADFDCNGNGVPDDCDLVNGTSEDCNGNASPDECDIADGTASDCNQNGTPDECDIMAGTSADCNANSVPDECDVADGTSPDCNENGVPDECDVADGSSADTNEDGIPDECQDCNENGVLDPDDIANGTSEDCNEDGIPDECQMSALPVFNVTSGLGYCRIQAAIDEATDGDEILVADGVYTGDGNRNIDFRGKAITVCSRNGPENCVIDCEQGGRGFYFHSGEGPDSKLEGLTIRRAFVSAPNNGGGVFCASSHPTLINCVFTLNTAGGAGGGLYCVNSSPVVSGCTFDGNVSTSSAGGAMKCYSGQPIFRNCTITNNTADLSAGGCMFSSGSMPLLVNCLISGNVSDDQSGGGLYFAVGTATMISCRITGNRAERAGGGLGCSYGDPTIVDCLIADNTADSGPGGAVYCEHGANPLFVDCTIAENAASQAGGAMYIEDSTVSASGCVFSGNTAPVGPEVRLFSDEAPSSLTVAYCDVEGGEPMIAVGEGCTLNWDPGNIDANPLFLDRDGPDDDPNTWEDNDFRLSAGSPCIDAGDNTAVPPDVADLDGDGDTDERTPFDLDGNPRFVEDPFTDDTGVPDPPCYRHVVDMGAYEFQFCFGDLDDDDDVDLADLAELLGSYGQTSGMTYYDGDLDGDGDVDLADLAELLGVYGTVCE